MPGGADGPVDGPDPWDGVVLDEAFVRAAARSEESADARAGAAARARAARHELDERRAREAASRPGGPAAGRRPLVWVLGVTALVLALIAVALIVQSGSIFEAAGTVGRRAPLLGSEPRPTPQPGSPSRLGPTPARSGTGPHAFMVEGPDGRPATYDPCREIRIVVNERTAPPDADLQLEAALREVSRATGLTFVVEGTTDEAPSPDRPAYQPERYGDRWAPVLVAWSDQGETERLGLDAAGLGGSVPITVDGHAVYVTGDITLDGPVLLAKGQYGGGAATQAIIMHELGHLVGLAHVDDPNQLMHADNDGQRGFGPGDLEGLAALGRGPCIDLL